MWSCIGYFLRRIEVRRRDVPALNLHAVGRRVPDLLDLAELLAGEDVFVDGRELLDLRPAFASRTRRCRGGVCSEVSDADGLALGEMLDAVSMCVPLVTG